MAEIDMHDLEVTVAMLRTICEAMEESDFFDDVNLHELGYGSLPVPQLNKLLLEACGPNSLEYEMVCGTPLNLQLLELLLNEGAEIECKDPEGNTPLYRSVLHDQLREMEFLLERGAVVNGLFHVANDVDGESCLSTALQVGNHEMVRLLLKHGASLKSPPGMLFFAAMGSDLEIVRILLDAGEDVRQINPTTGLSLSETSFMYGVFGRSIDWLIGWFTDWLVGRLIDWLIWFVF